MAKKIYQELTSADPGNGMAEADLGWNDLNIAEVLLRQAKVSEAAPLVREALPIFQKSNPATKYWNAVQLGQTYLVLGKVNAGRAQHAGYMTDKKRFWSEASFWYQKALDAHSTGPGSTGFGWS